MERIDRQQPRNSVFGKSKKPFENDRLEIDNTKIHGPLSFLNPTTAEYHSPSVDTEHASDVPSEPFTFIWRSRNNRKGRHAALQVPKTKSSQLPAPTSSMAEIASGVRRLFSFRPWDISWLVAQIFTWGSVVWVINGFFVFSPLTNPSTEFNGEILYAGGITAFVGAIVFFETGSILLMLEAINENRGDCFGWEVEQLFEGPTIRPAPANCAHRFHDKRTPGEDRGWQWLPTWHDLQTHYFHELGFLASLAQLFGATIFGISGFTALPGIQNHLSQRVLNGVYWIPQMVGGSGFVVSSTCYMLETQKNWYTPALDILGWHVGFWNFVGAIGFTLSGALGPAYGSSGAQFQAACATFWGSWAFLIGSVLQLYESVQKFPVEKAKEE